MGSDCACQGRDLQWVGGSLDFAFLELTFACNNLCTGCSNLFIGEKASAPLSGKEWIDLIQRLRPRLRWVKLTGGEPTLHPDFGQIATFLDESGFPFLLLTNGKWADPLQTVTQLRQWRNSEGLLISLHGPDASSHEGFSGVPGSFVETTRNIRLATEAGLKVTISTVITRYNWNRMEEMVALTRSLGAHCISFGRYIGPPLSGLEATPTQVQQATHQMEQMLAEGGSVRIGNPLPQCFTSIEMTPCLASEALISVDPWGRVRPCSHAPVYLGDLRTQSLDEILDSKTTHWWRAMIPEECSNCALSFCRGGCRAEAMLRSQETYSLPRLLVQFPSHAEVSV